MTLDQLTAAAKAAYEAYSASDPKAVQWEHIKNQHYWRDLIAEYERSPWAQPVNPMEEAAKAAYLAARDAQAVDTAKLPPIVVTAPTPKPEPKTIKQTPKKEGK